MNLSSFSVKKPVTITMIVLIVVLLGAISLSRLPIDLFPEMEIPVAVVSTSYTGAGPQEIENLITKRIEGAIATVSGIDNVSSISSQGSSIVIAQFNNGTNMDFAALEMREKIDMVKGFLPDDAAQPMVMKLDLNSMPIIEIAVSTNGDLSGLQSLAEETFQQRLERIDGVASVSVGGGFVREIEVLVDPSTLSGYGLSTNQLAQLLAAANMNLPGGNVERGDQKLSIRVVGEFKSLEEIKNMPLTLPTGDVITLKDVAEIQLGYKEVSNLSRVNGKDSISISVQKQSGKNTVKVADTVLKEIESLRKDFPGVEFNIVADNSEMIKTSINNVVKNVLMGAIFAILILYIFLKNIRTTLIIGISIPISVIASFILLYFNGITLNMMTLGGLALAVGMLVDSAIVVLENIYRFRSEGLSKQEAAIKGSSEVAMAITASTLTTIAVFLPIAFIDGMVGTMFKEFAMTVTLSLGASLLVSITLIPMLSSKILTVELDTKATGRKKKKLDFIYTAFDRVFGKVEALYKNLLATSLRRRKLTIGISALIFLLSIASLIFVGMEYFPIADEGRLSISVQLPLGTKLEQLDAVVQSIEGKLAEIPEVDVIFTSVGARNVIMGGGSSNSSSGTISVNLVNLRERERNTSEVVEEVRGLVKDIPGANISVSAVSTMSITSSDPVNISIAGDDFTELERISNDFKTIVESVEGTREAKTSISDAVPEVEVLVNKDNAAMYGLTAAQIATAVRGSASGTTATKYRYDGNELDVVIRASGGITESLSNLEQLSISSPAGVNIPLSQVAKVSIVRGPMQVNRDSQERSVTVTSQIVGRDIRSITNDIEKGLEGYEMPKGYSYKIGGENQQLNEAFTQLLLALVLAIILIYMVMAAQFESLIYPFIIMFTIPLAFGGGALSLFLTGRAFGVTAFIGIIMLSGIVVNNGIVLIDYINILRNSGQSREEAIITAGPVRLRPILMTTLTTALGLIPLALGIGEGAEMQAPMATVVIGGLLLSTILTLVFVPVLYTIFDDLSISVKSRFKKLTASTTEA